MGKGNEAPGEKKVNQGTVGSQKVLKVGEGLQEERSSTVSNLTGLMRK